MTTDPKITNPRAKTCVCDSRYDGCVHANPCLVLVEDASWGPWCGDCNPRRLAALRADLARLKGGAA